MSDSLYIVSRDEQDQYVKLLNLEEAGVIFKQRDTLRISMGSRQPVYATSERRRGGAVQVSESRDLASVAATFMVKGDTTDQAIERLEDLLAQADAAAERWIWWEPDGASRVSLYPLVGPAQCSVNYSWPWLMSGYFPCEASWAAQPWVEGLVQDVADDFRARDVGAAGVALSALQQFDQDYTTPVTPTTVAQGALELPHSMSSAQALISRLDREPWQDGRVTVKGKAKTGTTDTERIISPGLRYSLTSGGYFYAQLNGGFLRVREFDGVATTSNRASAAQVAPAANVSYWLVCRAEGTSVTAEYWTTRPTPTGSPTATCTYTNVATLRSGYPLLMSAAPTAGATNIPIVEEFESRPYSWRLLNTPTTVNVEALPGSMAAAADIDFSPATTDSDYPRHALYGWRRKYASSAPAVAGTTPATSLLIPGESFAHYTGSTTAVLATDAVRYRGVANQAITVPVLATAGMTSIAVTVDPTLYAADEFADTVTCAVVVRYYRQADIVTPRIAAAVAPAGTTTVLPPPLLPPLEYTPEFGSTGRYLPGAAATARVTTTTLGTVTLQRTPQLASLFLFVSWAAGSTAAQVLAVDEVYLVPVAGLAMSPTDKARDDGTYPSFVRGLGTGSTMRVESRRRGMRRLTAATEGANRWFTPVPLGIGGADIELPTASEGVELLVRPSVSVPDDPVYLTTADILSHNASVHLRVTPRYRFVA
jgi:hypothetical protein